MALPLAFLEEVNVLARVESVNSEEEEDVVVVLLVEDSRDRVLGEREVGRRASLSVDLPPPRWGYRRLSLLLLVAESAEGG